MGLRSSDESGDFSGAEMSAMMREVKALREVVRLLIPAVDSNTLISVWERPEVQRAVKFGYEGIVK